ncbi:hypothetical protein B0A55_01681 [Friedmanniomyces simplex]|uniref:AB hydrolase-1 domain-containing protein n=1 Tax=Friedmanniomyces simplex TaxID=329884 RepID=A0A4U0XWQ9_9PEZI|nr:hypothetical protein B0A55_01681 [Friedmanniomyces simplex]
MYNSAILVQYAVRGPRRFPARYTALRKVLPGNARDLFHVQQRPLASRPWRPSSRLSPPRTRPAHIYKRTFLIESVPTALVPPVVFTGLLVALWAYKCLMTVVFQEKIIYMPYMPPFARSEKIADYVVTCRPVEWREERIRSEDGTKISLCVGWIPNIPGEQRKEGKETVICYFQGNGSSLPPRLPLLSQVLKLIHASGGPRCTMVALSYRGYWTSSGRASQKGIELDAQAMLKWVAKTFSSDARLILWGQSVGAGVASNAAAYHVERHDTPPVVGLIMETPFTSIKSMLLALYPQKWLPYRYLSPFLRSHWDSGAALRRIAGTGTERFRILLLPASRDEVVPPEEIQVLEKICQDLKLEYERKKILGALHTEATSRREGQQGVAEFVRKVVDR